MIIVIKLRLKSSWSNYCGLLGIINLNFGFISFKAVDATNSNYSYCLILYNLMVVKQWTNSKIFIALQKYSALALDFIHKIIIFSK